jgi:hypothetical protein
MSYQPIAGLVSTDNSTSETLGASATYTGTWEDISNYGSISVIASADQNATLWADFSIDGVTATRNIQLSTGTDTSLGIHSLIPVSQYFRVRVVDAGSGATIDVQTLYYKTARIAQPTSRLGQALSTYSDVLNTRAILANTAGTNVAVTDHNALQVTPPASEKSAFGEALVTNLDHELIASFTYNINPNQVTKQENLSGTVTQLSGQAEISTGPTGSSSAMMLTNDTIRYQPGHGSRARFTAAFTSGVAGSTQTAGIGNSNNGFFFGYNGPDFGILHRYNGTPEVQTLTVATGSSTAENITITLDDTAETTVAVTNTADATITANEIALHDYSNVGKGWDAYAIGDTVEFTSWDSSPHTGVYSLTSATTAAGTFANVISGTAPTEDWINQTGWNGVDIFDGNGLTETTLDPTKGNVYQIAYQWLGYGLITFYAEDPDDGEFHLLHGIPYANANNIPSLSNPTLPISMKAENTSNTSEITTRVASLGGFTDGQSELIGPRFAQSASVTLGATSAETPFLTIRNRGIFQGKINTHRIKILLLSASVEHSKPVQVVVYKDSELTGASFSDYDSEGSSLQVDTTATAFTNGKEILSLSLGKTGQETIDLTSDKFGGVLLPNDSLTVTIKPSSGNAAEANVSIYMVELF